MIVNVNVLWEYSTVHSSFSKEKCSASVGYCRPTCTDDPRARIDDIIQTSKCLLFLTETSVFS